MRISPRGTALLGLRVIGFRLVTPRPTMVVEGKEHALGDTQAPLTITEYASLTRSQGVEELAGIIDPLRG